MMNQRLLMSAARGSGLGEELTKNDEPEATNVCWRERVRRRAYQE